MDPLSRGVIRRVKSDPSEWLACPQGELGFSVHGMDLMRCVQPLLKPSNLVLRLDAGKALINSVLSNLSNLSNLFYSRVCARACVRARARACARARVRA